MIRKKIDDRIKILIQNIVNSNERGIFIIIGDKARDQISNIHNFYNKLNPGKKLNILWCYKKELGFSNHAKKKMKKIKKQMNKGVFELNDENSFDLFISTSDIKFCFYHDTQRILGTTYGMLVLQDFEAITPNLLCRTIETVQGGGIIIFLLSNMTSLKQLYTISMDVHARYRTENNKDIQPRFNERFILSLSECQNCLCVDDELNLLPITKNMKNLKVIEKNIDLENENVFIDKRQKELKELQKTFEGKFPLGNLINICKTVDQAKSIMLMINSISEKNNKKVISITSARGRGKSSAMGLAIASAIVYGYSNILVSAPSPENLKTLFEFLIKGLNCLDYQEHKDYTIQEGEGEFKNTIVSITISKDHKQTIRYILPSDIIIFQMAEMIVIDEAAAIPLHIVKKLISPDCLTFISSTIQGYEGTGRSLSIKLIDGLRNNKDKTGKILNEVSLNQAIRYADDDKVEQWLNSLLLLDATVAEPFEENLLDPKKLELYYVNRDTLFSYHKTSEKFLRKIMSLFVSSHYKNSPNDLQLLSDAPAHNIFVLCRNIEKNDESNQSSLPDIYCAIQTCEEGGISKDVILDNTKRGLKPSGDLIPWTISEHFQDKEFAKMIGVRIVRIACHPDYTKMGYASRALELLSQYYEGNFVNLDINKKDDEEDENMDDNINDNDGDKTLKKKKKLKPLLCKLTDVKPNYTYYLGTSFGLTKDLFHFWNKNGYKPLYLKLTPNDITGEHSCILIKPIKEGNVGILDDLANNIINDSSTNKIKWINPFVTDFKHRFISLLSYEFKELSIKLSLTILEPNLTSTTNNDDNNLNDENNYTNCIIDNKEKIELFISKYDFKRLEMYSKNLVNYSTIIDLVPILSKLYFDKKIIINLSYIQAGILLGIGCQYKNFDQIKEEFEIETSQLLAMFNKMMKKFVSFIRNIYEKDIEFNEKIEQENNKVNLNINEEIRIKNQEKILKEMKNELKDDEEKIKNQEKLTKRKYMEEKLKKMDEEITLNKKRKRDKSKKEDEDDDE